MEFVVVVVDVVVDAVVVVVVAAVAYARQLANTLRLLPTNYCGPIDRLSAGSERDKAKSERE